MASAIEVVGDSEGETSAEVLFEGQVSLLRIRINKVIRLRISEGLESLAAERRIATSGVLIHEGERKVQSLKLLLVGQKPSAEAAAGIRSPRRDWLELG